jgi:putative spermidine/putrescine transport system permease protein
MSEELVAVEAPGRRRWIARPLVWLVWGVLAFFFLNLAGVVISVVVDSFGDDWFSNWLPQTYTLHYWVDAWHRYDLTTVLKVTLIVSLAVVAVSALVGVPASYVMARRNFPGKRLVMLVFLLPVMVPPLAYGIPMTTAMYKFNSITHIQVADSVLGVVLANLVPSIPFVVLTMTPFIEQIDPKVESAARMCGATTRRIFTRILLPLLLPGVLAASILVLVRTIGMFELTYLVSNGPSQTLVVKIFDSMAGSGVRAQQQTDAMAVIYMLTMLVLLVLALRFINPTQLVTRVAEEREA